GMFTRRAHQFGALSGGIVGTLVSIYLAFVIRIEFIWPTVYGLLATLSVGYLMSVLTPMLRAGGNSELTWKRVMSRVINAEGELMSTAPQREAVLSGLAVG